MMKCVNVRKEDVFEILAKNIEVYAANYDNEILSNLYYSPVCEIHDILNNENKMINYVFFYIEEEEKRKEQKHDE